MAGSRREWGSVRHLPSGRWQARYPAPDGVLRPAPHTFDTKTDAARWLVVKRSEVIRGDWFDPDAGSVLVSEYVARWIKDRPHLAPTTSHRYRGLLERYIAPTLGAVELRDVTPAVVRSWRTSLLDGGAGEVSVAKAYRLLHAAMNTAVNDDELIRRNPCRIRGAASERRRQRVAPTLGEVYAIARAIAPRWRVLVLLAAFGAMRWGELAALRRRHLNLDAMTVTVEAGVVEIVGHLIEGPPKSEAGKRTVALPVVLAPELAQHLQAWSEAGPDGRVFVGARGGPMRRSNFQRSWGKATLAAGVDVRFHDLRHAGATWAAQSGATIKELMERLGHSSPTAAMIYQHAATDRDRLIADGLNVQAEAEFARKVIGWLCCWLGSGT